MRYASVFIICLFFLLGAGCKFGSDNNVPTGSDSKGPRINVGNGPGGTPADIQDFAGIFAWAFRQLKSFLPENLLSAQISEGSGTATITSSDGSQTPATLVGVFCNVFYVVRLPNGSFLILTLTEHEPPPTEGGQPIVPIAISFHDSLAWVLFRSSSQAIIPGHANSTTFWGQLCNRTTDVLAPQYHEFNATLTMSTITMVNEIGNVLKTPGAVGNGQQPLLILSSPPPGTIDLVPSTVYAAGTN